MAFHHVAFATRDLEATHHFYEDLMGFPLVHSELEDRGDDIWMKHVFYDTGNGECIAFFAFDGIGEQPGYKTDLSESVGVPVWVNHCAFDATADMQQGLKDRMSAAGIDPLMELDHVWCHSLYYVDPNGIMVEFCRDNPGFEPDPVTALARMREAVGSATAGG